MEPAIILVILFILFFIIIFAVTVRRYKRCPSDRILVVYGKVGGGRSVKCYHGGAAFIMPIIQDYEYLDLKPISAEIGGKFNDKYNFPIDLSAEIKFAISTEPAVMYNAAERLLGLSESEIKALGTDIIYGQTRVVIAQTDIIEILEDNEKLIYMLSEEIEHELSKLGLKLVTISLKEISDKYRLSDQLSKQAKKLIQSKQITNAVDIDDHISQLKDIDDRLESIEKERSELLNKKIQIISQLEKK